MLHMQI